MAKRHEIDELQAEQFSQFLSWLNPVRETAGEEYEKLRFRLMTFFSHRNCRFPEDLADETINRIILKIQAETIENKLAYCYAVARNVFLESLRKDKIHENIDEIQVTSKHEEVEEIENPCLDKCLNKLPSENKSLILDYFSETNQQKIDLHKTMSEKMYISQTALRMKIMRIKRNLKKCLNECLAT